MFKGIIEKDASRAKLVRTEFSSIPFNFYRDEAFYSLDNSHQAILAYGKYYDTYLIKDHQDLNLGYLTINCLRCAKFATSHCSTAR